MQRYRRVLLKLSGEYFACVGGAHGEDADSGFALERLRRFAVDAGACARQGVGVMLVIGGGNLIRGQSLARHRVDRVTADYMGMLATVVNGLLLHRLCRDADIPATVMSLLSMPGTVDDYDIERADRALQAGHVLIFAGGTGKPLCTTDSAAAQRAVDMKADIILKATKVDGVYSADPMRHADAKLYHRLSYDEVIERDLAVMDKQAVVDCRRHGIPIRVFGMNRSQAIKHALAGEDVGTLVDAS